MGKIIAILEFENRLPTTQMLQQQLNQTTKLTIQIEELDQHDPDNKWIIRFKPPTDDYNTDIEIRWSGKSAYVGEGLNSLYMDNLNLCPNYSFVATVAALQDLGGNDEFVGNVPVYARHSFADWKKLNKGLTPAWWKQVLGWILAGISFLVVGGAFALLFLIFKLADLLFGIAGFFGKRLKHRGETRDGF